MAREKMRDGTGPVDRECVCRERAVWHAHARFRARQARVQVGYAGNSGARSYSPWGALEQLTAWSWSLRLRTQWGSSRIRKISGHQAQSRNTPMKCEAAVAIPASKGLALVSVCRQHARKSFVPQCTCFSFLEWYTTRLAYGILKFSKISQRNGYGKTRAAAVT